MTENTIMTPEEAGKQLRQYGLAQEHWQDVIDLGLYNHDIRTMAHIALGATPVDYLEKFTELFGNDEHGPRRIENARQDLKNRNEV